MGSSHVDLDVTHAGVVETQGIEFVPLSERWSGPRDVSVVMLVANLCFSVIAVGFVPIAVGLTLPMAVLTVVGGSLLGSALFACFGLLGPRTGTNGPVSTGAFFGVKGRIVGTIVAGCTAIGSVALAVWVSGEFIVSTAIRLFSLDDASPLLSAISYASVFIGCVVLAMFGSRLIVLSQRFLLLPVLAVMIVGFFIMGPRYDGAGTSFGAGASASSVAIAVLTGVSTALSYCSLVNDYTRYIHPARYTGRRIAVWSAVGLFVGLSVSLIFGALMASVVANPDPISGAALELPLWYVLCLSFVAILGGFGQAGVALYATGLDLSSVFPRLTRLWATLSMALVAAVLVYLGVFVWNALSSLAVLLAVLAALAVPWICVTYCGMYLTGNRFYAQDLQRFVRRETGGLYWYRNGWHRTAMLAWTVGSVAALAFVNTGTVAGPGGKFLGFDASLPAGIVGTIAALFVSARMLDGRWDPWWSFNREDEAELERGLGDEVVPS